MRKGEFSGHIIMFVLGLVVVAGILFFGYTVIQNTIESQCETERVRFGTQLQTLFERNRGFGTSRTVDVSLPCQTTAICFVPRDLIDLAAGGQGASSFSYVGTIPAAAQRVIESSINAGVPANVFMIETQGTAVPVQRFSAQSAPIRTNDQNDIVCAEGTGGLVSLRLQGTGQYARVSIPS